MKKIILAQIDTIAGNIKYNSEKIKNAIKKAITLNAELIVFPELALFGANYGNIAQRHHSLLKLQEQELEEIRTICKGITAIVGYLDNSEESSLAIIQNCEIRHTKQPTNFTINNKNYAVCLESELFQPTIPIEALIIPTASSSRTGKEFLLAKKLSSIAKKLKTNVIYVNQVGYSNDFVFEGGSRIYNKFGEISAQGEFFEEDFIETVNFSGEKSNTPFNQEKYNQETFSLNYENDLERTYKAVLCAIKGYFSKNGFQKAVLGLSGGLDSTVSLVLLVDALGKENVLGVSMPTKITSCSSKQDAQILAQNLGIEFLEVPIAAQVEIFNNSLKEIFSKIAKTQYQKSTTFENIQARTRATILWSLANECKSMLPIATSDKSELYIGYATINGDMSGGFAPLADITKTKLFALADFLNKYRVEKNVIPASILEKPPGAELKFDESKGRTITAEEDNMPYPFLDEIIWHVENKNYGYDELINHDFIFEKENNISKEQKSEWILKFFDKAQKAVFKWHLLPPSVIIDSKSINKTEYHHPVISKFLAK